MMITSNLFGESENKVRAVERLPGSQLPPGISESEFEAFNRVTCQILTEEQIERIVNPAETYADHEVVTSLHWHPEFVPMNLIRTRIDRMFPGKKRELFIPTQHNVVMTYDNQYAGVEVDCFSPEFNLKVQLLCHFRLDKVKGATKFLKMMDETFKYRASQLYEFIASIIDPKFQDRLNEAAHLVGANAAVVEFVKAQTEKLNLLIQEYETTIPAEMLRNKLVRNYFEELKLEHDHDLIHSSQVLLTMVKKIVKRGFDPSFFYKTQEIIEEVRALDGGIIIPHPEQFWPILMADYDIDGVEVWNPQSQRYTDFLIEAIQRKNESRRSGERELLMTMGDDCHMGEKVKDPAQANAEKVSRQIGFQRWESTKLQKVLAKSHYDRDALIQRYTERLH